MKSCSHCIKTCKPVKCFVETSAERLLPTAIFARLVPYYITIHPFEDNVMEKQIKFAIIGPGAMGEASSLDLIRFRLLHLISSRSRPSQKARLELRQNMASFTTNNVEGRQTSGYRRSLGQNPAAANSSFWIAWSNRPERWFYRCRGASIQGISQGLITPILCEPANTPAQIGQASPSGHFPESVSDDQNTRPQHPHRVRTRNLPG